MEALQRTVGRSGFGVGATEAALVALALVLAVAVGRTAPEAVATLGAVPVGLDVPSAQPNAGASAMARIRVNRSLTSVTESWA